jgi:hypothetical protein
VLRFSTSLRGRVPARAGHPVRARKRALRERNALLQLGRHDRLGEPVGAAGTTASGQGHRRRGRGTGGNAALALVTSGIGQVHCIDRDVVQLSNLKRHVLFTETDIGRPKVDTGHRLVEPSSTGQGKGVNLHGRDRDSRT